MLGSEELLGAIARQILHHIGKLASAVITLPRIAFRIFIGENRPHGFEHSFADKILGRDQLEALMLASFFIGNGIGYVGINFRKRAGHAVRGHGGLSVF